MKSKKIILTCMACICAISMFVGCSSDMADEQNKDNSGTTITDTDKNNSDKNDSSVTDNMDELKDDVKDTADDIKDSVTGDKNPNSAGNSAGMN